MNLDTRFSFFPVGQGMFSTGALSTHETLRPILRWVYDCGTVTRWQKQLEQEIARVESLARLDYVATPSVKPKLHVVFISHFDLDHVSGLVRLLQTFDVEALVLPYMPLWQRVAAAVKSKRFDNPSEQAIFVNPMAFVAGIEGANVAQIILVIPSGGGSGSSPPRLPMNCRPSLSPVEAMRQRQVMLT